MGVGPPTGPTPGPAPPDGAVMGIYDREYYRDGTQGSGWFSGMAPACRMIVVANVAAFVGQKLFPGQLEAREPGRLDVTYLVRGPQAWRLRLTRTAACC